MKIIKKLVFTVSLFVISSAMMMSQTIFSNYKISFGNLYTIKDGDLIKESVDGEYTVIDEGGRSVIATIKNGQIDGEFKEYYENGELYIIGKYINGMKQESWKTYSETGKLWIKDEYKDGKLNGEHYKNYTSTMKYSEYGNYKDGTKNGKWTEYYENGEKSSEGNYYNNQKVDEWIEWSSTGKKDTEANYINGELYGKTIRYQGNGKIFYEADIEESETKIKAYFPDGNINFEGLLVNNKRSGKWKFYDKNKSVISIKEYENGTLINN